MSLIGLQLVMSDNFTIIMNRAKCLQCCKKSDIFHSNSAEGSKVTITVFYIDRADCTGSIA
jgi:hypothetical protein